MSNLVTVPARAAQARQPRPPSPLRDPVLWSLLAVQFVVTVWYALGWGTAYVDASLFWLTQAALDVVFAVLCWRASRAEGAADTTRRLWRKAIFVGVFFTIGDSIQAGLTLADFHPPGTYTGTVQSTLLLAGSVWFLIAVLTHPAKLTGRERLRFALDVTTIMAGTAMFVWYVSSQAAREQGVTGTLMSQSAIAMVCAFAMVRLLLAGNSPFTPTVGVIGGLAITMLVANDSLAVTQPESHTELGLAIRLLPCLLIAAGPRVQELQIRADPQTVGWRRTRPYSVAAYAAVAGAQILLLVALSRESLESPAWGVVFGAIVVMVLVVIRQQVAFADNARLLAEVDRGMVKLRQQKERLRALVQHSTEIIAVLDTEWRITYVSPAVEQVLGVAPDEAVGKNLGDLLASHDSDAGRADLETALAAPGACLTQQLRIRHADGSWRWLSLVATNMRDTPGIGGIVCNARDITETVTFQQRLRFEATHDPLTLLANRTLLEERIRGGNAAGNGHVLDDAVILMIDLDDFKLVNDTYGHHAGDQLLTGVAERLKTCSRTGDTVARFGGDEFAVLLPGSSLEEGTRIAERILDALAEPILVDGLPLRVRASIGVAAGSVADAQGLMRAADAAMYSAKQRGKDTFVTAAV